VVLEESITKKRRGRLAIEKLYMNYREKVWLKGFNFM
jgi:hypothetical protein